MKENSNQDSKSKQLVEVLDKNLSKSRQKLNKALLELIALFILALCKTDGEFP